MVLDDLAFDTIFSVWLPSMSIHPPMVLLVHVQYGVRTVCVPTPSACRADTGTVVAEEHVHNLRHQFKPLSTRMTHTPRKIGVCIRTESTLTRLADGLIEESLRNATRAEG